MARTSSHRTRHHARTRTPEAKAERRTELLEAAIACIRRVGPDASMEQIAAEANVTKPVLYRYFTDKGDLYRAVAEHFAPVVTARLVTAMVGTGEPRERLVQGIDAFVGLVEQEPEVYRFLMKRARLESSGTAAEIEDFVRTLGTDVGVVLGEQLAADGVDTGGAEVWGHAVVGMVQAATDWWVERRVLSRKRLVEYLADLLWGGFESFAPTSTSAAAEVPA